MNPVTMVFAEHIANYPPESGHKLDWFHLCRLQHRCLLSDDHRLAGSKIHER